MLKYCKQQRDLFDNQLIIANVDPVEYIKGMLDEQEDARPKDFLRGGGKDEGQREQSGTSRCECSCEGMI